MPPTCLFSYHLQVPLNESLFKFLLRSSLLLLEIAFKACKTEPTSFGEC